MPRFTFRIDSPPADAQVFAQAAQKLVLNGLISQTQDLQVFLTDAGLQYCRDHFRTFPLDIYFEPPLPTEGNLAKALGKIKGTSKNLRRSLPAREICNRIGSVQHC
jgi:hypothetical protein